jgi:hypothetical protein
MDDITKNELGFFQADGEDHYINDKGYILQYHRGQLELICEGYCEFDVETKEDIQMILQGFSAMRTYGASIIAGGGKLNKMTDKKFSEIYNGFDGSDIDKAAQITIHNFTGEELKEYTEHVLNNHSVLHSIIDRTQNAPRQYEQLKQLILSETQRIDNETGWQATEPKWWLEMMNLQQSCR